MLEAKYDRVRNILHLIGVIDETTSIREHLEDTLTKLNLDASGIERINSFGVRVWLETFKEFQHLNITLINCSQVLVDQFNMIPEMLDNLGIESFYASYYCEKCDKEQSVLLNCVEDFPVREDPIESPDRMCDCGTKMRFYEEEEEYLGLLELID